MKKNLLLSAAAVAVLVFSLAINLNTKTTATNTNLAELVQTASADEFWTLTMCTDPYMGQAWMIEEPHWWLGAMYDVPVDYHSYPIECCLAGGMDPCQAAMIPREDMFDGYGQGGEDIIIQKDGRWVGGQDVDLMRDPLIWDPMMFDLIRTINGNVHQIR